MIIRRRWLKIAAMMTLLAVAVRADTWLRDTSFAPVFESSAVHAGSISPVALPDGGVLVSTTYSYVDGHSVSGLARIKADGAYDADFQPAFTSSVNVLAVYSDGRLIVSHDTYETYTTRRLHRLLATGVLDASFTPVVLDYSSGGPLVRILSDGKLILGGQFTTVAGQRSPFVARLNADGSVDTTFTSPFTEASVTVRDLCPQADGKIVLTGDFSAKGISSTLMRLSASGAIDGAFPAVTVTTEFSALTILADGKIMAATSSGGTARRFSADGSLDSGYTAAFPSLTSYVSRPLPSGRLYFLESPGGGETKLRRLNADGSIDTAFAYSTTGTSDFAVGLPATWDENTFFIASALTAERLAYRQELSKLNSSATLQTSFAPRFSRLGAPSSIVWKSDGSYLFRAGCDYLSGTAVTVGSWVHLKADGSLDSATSLPSCSILATAPDGHFVASVSSDSGSSVRFVLFGADGAQQATLSLTVSSREFVFDASGRLYTRDGAGVIQRFLADGTLDASFSSGSTGLCYGLYPARDGSAYVLLSVKEYTLQWYKVFRLLASGAIDTAFTPITISSPSGVLGRALPDGSLLLIEQRSLGTSGAYLACRRFDTTGTAIYTYNGSPTADTLAGVALDCLLASSSSTGEHLSLAGSVFYNQVSLPDWLEVRRDGGYSVYTGNSDASGYFQRYARTDLSTPSVSMAPAVGLGPQSASVRVGDYGLTLMVYPLGAEPFTYEWKKDGQPIGNRSSWSLPANSPSLFLANTVAADAGSYTVTVSNAYGTITTAPAVITILSAPVISTPPANLTVASGGSGSFSVQASGTPTPTYAWEGLLPGATAWTALQDGATYAGVSTATLAISSATLNLSGAQYRCVVRNSEGSVTSTAVTLTVTALPRTTPTITWSAPATIPLGTALSSAQLNAAASVPGTFVYSPASGTVLAVGSHTLDVTFTPTDTASYSTATAQVTLTVVTSDYTGTYFGNFAAGGYWALRVEADRSATYLGYVAGRRSALVVRLTISTDGSFSAAGTEIVATADAALASALAVGASAPSVQASGFTLAGSIVGGQVTGQLAGLGETFSGAVEAAAGSALAGYYAATALGTGSGSVYALVASSGRALVVAATDTLVDAVTGSVGAGGTLTSTSTSGASFAVNLAASASALTAAITPAGGGTAASFAGLAEGAVASTHLVNISARARCTTGDGVTIGGFVITGSGTKRVLIRAVGPSLTAQGLTASEVLADPTIEVYHDGSIKATNDNWGDNPNAAEIATVGSQIGAVALAAGDTTSAAMLLALDPGVYSFVVHGKTDTSGIVLLEIYDADTANTAATFSNISARAFCTSGNGVTIGGFVVTGNAPKRVLLRGVGPSLATQGLKVTDVLADPSIELHDATSTLIVNDNLADASNATAVVPAGARLGATPLDQSDTKSSALLFTLQPGAYSFIAKGPTDANGIVLIEVYDAD